MKPKMKKTEPITTIPPKSIFSTDELDTTFNLVPSNNFKIDELKATKLMKPSILEKNKLLPALSVSYDEDESIIAFRNRLAIAYKKNQFTMVEHKFYVENLLEIHKSCFDFEKYNDKTKFYIDFIKKQNAHNP